KAGSKTEMVAVAEVASGYLAAAEFDRETGSAVANIAAAHIDKYPAYEKLSANERQLHQVVERSRLDKVWRADAAKNVRIAQMMVQRIEKHQPGFVAMLNKSGLGNSSSLAVQLF